MRKLYVGAQNDGLFVIDREPSSAGADIPVGFGTQANVIAKMADNDSEARALAKKFAAAPELYDALETLCLVVGLTAIKYAAQLPPLQEAIDAANVALRKARVRA